MLRHGFSAILLLLLSTLARAGDVDLHDQHAEAMRRWLAGDGDQSLGEGDPWLQYIALDRHSLAARETGLRTLLENDPPESLRRILLIDLQSDLGFKSDQAQFIRRYGFYANWFNRAFYVASRAVQGNVTAAGQLAVDAVFDFSARGRATAAERKLYKLLDDLRAEGRTTRQDREHIRDLRRKIENAQSALELERAKWALRQGQPELARYYAEGAQSGSVKRDAAEVAHEADREIARRIRGSIASAQAGYPDRVPPIDLNAPSLLRAALTGTIEHHASNALLIPGDPDPAKRVLVTSTTHPYKGDPPEGGEVQTIRTENFVLAWMLTTLETEENDPVGAMRRWARVIETMGVDPRRTAWVKSSLENPAFNPELRLIQAQAARRAGLGRFIFVGPQTGRERAYIASSRFAQTWNAVASVGVFYVFEIMYRAGIAAIKPPAPEEEIFDSQAAFLRAAPDNPDTPLIARQLAEQYLTANRPDNAEATLTAFGELDAESEKRIARSRAAIALEQAAKLPLDSQARKKLIEHARELAQGTRLARRADKLENEKPRREEPVTLRATWESLGQWVGDKAPSGLPGDPIWFDGDLTNGEIEHPWFLIESEGDKAKEVQVTYHVRLGDRGEIVSETVEIAQMSPATARWIGLAVAQQARMNRENQLLGRPPIGYELTGGAGLSGVDFYPRLLPMESAPGETRLYEEPKED